MATRVNLDAMIPRADFATEDNTDYTIDLFTNFPIANLENGNPIRTLLRKPDFQRETNHWDPRQIATFIASFLDSELIPSLILWKSSSYIFVIDGGHRLSALRAWIEDDYGDGPISQKFYNNDISDDARRAARRARQLVEQKVGRFSLLKSIVNNASHGDELQTRRAGRLFTRSLNLQWVQGSASVAETSFFKINSQGTPLDDTEEMLLRNRRKPIAIGARAILRSGTGHKYWSAFEPGLQKQIENSAEELFKLLFEPEVDQPVKTLDLPLGGSVSPVDALSLLIEFLSIANSTQTETKNISAYEDDATGEETASILKRSIEVTRRITGNDKGSLGLHPAVYFYNERGKHSRFLFLGMVTLMTSKIRNNDKEFFRRFTLARRKLEAFLIENKSLVGILLQNMSKRTRVSKMRDLVEFLVAKFSADQEVRIEQAIEHLGARGRIYDITTAAQNASFSEEAKSAMYVKRAVASAISCNLCGGLLDPQKSVSYDHIVRVREGGKGDVENGDLTHPYCNQSLKN
ncbi:HNH endonuclease family protein [Sinorhizobium medicae]